MEAMLKTLTSLTSVCLATKFLLWQPSRCIERSLGRKYAVTTQPGGPSISPRLEDPAIPLEALDSEHHEVTNGCCPKPLHLAVWLSSSGRPTHPHWLQLTLGLPHQSWSSVSAKSQVPVATAVTVSPELVAALFNTTRALRLYTQCLSQEAHGGNACPLPGVSQLVEGRARSAALALLLSACSPIRAFYNTCCTALVTAAC